MTWAEAPGAPWWFVLALAVAGAFVGEVLRRRVATGGYRLDDETGPLPRVPSVAVPVALALLWGLLGWRFGPLSDWALTPAYLAFAFVAVALLWTIYFVLALVAALLGSGFGYGDVTLAGLVGLATGYVSVSTTLVASYAAFILAGVYGVVRLLLRRGSRKDDIAFGPWMLVGLLLSLVVQMRPLV